MLLCELAAEAQGRRADAARKARRPVSGSTACHAENGPSRCSMPGIEGMQQMQS